MTRARGEAGFMLTDIAVTMMILSIVAAALVGVLQSQTNAEKHVQSAVANQEQVRLAVVEMQRDIRSSEPLVELDNAEDYKTTLRLLIVDLDNTQTRLQWRFDALNGELVREDLDSTGTATGVTYRLRGVTVPGGRLFRYWNSNGIELDTASSKEIANCTIRVQVSLMAAPESGPNPFEVRSDADLRNRLPGGLGC